jgi:hypothetical protein
MRSEKMLHRKTNFLVSMTLTAAMLLVPGTALGAATVVEVSGEQFTVGILDPGTEWTDDEGITHVRGLILDVSFTGDIAGSVTQVLNYNMDASGNGDLYGSAEFEGTVFGEEAVLTGRFSGDISGGVYSGDSIGHGTIGGALAHSRLTTTGVLGSGYGTYTGTIQFPHGQ